jgi:hypothetical protein
MRMVEEVLPPTRAELEEILREHDFEPSAGAAHVWQNPERTKFLSFPEGEVPDGKEATAIYGDAERGEPGKALTFRQVRAVVTQRFEIDSPELAKLALPPPKAQPEPALPAAASAANVIEGELEETKP